MYANKLPRAIEAAATPTSLIANAAEVAVGDAGGAATNNCSCRKRWSNFSIGWPTGASTTERERFNQVTLTSVANRHNIRSAASAIAALALISIPQRADHHRALAEADEMMADDHRP